MHLCVRACVRACVRVWLCVCVCVGAGQARKLGQRGGEVVLGGEGKGTGPAGQSQWEAEGDVTTAPAGQSQYYAPAPAGQAQYLTFLLQADGFL